MWLSKYFVYFCVYSVMGWIYESIHCSIHERKWANRGFLFGPVVPIYGVGGVALMGVMNLVQYLMPGTELRWWQIFLIAYLGSVVLEYSTHYAMEKLFHAKWWDYSYMPLNIKGRVCVPYSICFGLAGLLVSNFVAPFTTKLLSWIPPIGFEFFSLIFAAVMVADATLTVSALTDFDENIIAMEKEINARMDVFVAELVERQEREAAAQHEKRAEREAAMQARIAAERERLSALNTESLLASMGKARRAALNRVSGFSRPKVDDSRIFALIAGMKKRVTEKNRAVAENAKQAEAADNKND